MIHFRGVCPGCNKLSLVDVNTPCPNVFNDGRTCGYALTTSLTSGNSVFRKKHEKHTNPLPSGSTADHSWTSSGLYDVHQTAALSSGVLGYNPVNNYFCLTHPVPSGEACVTYRSGTTADAWYLSMPLNSKWPNLHLHYRESVSGVIPIAEGDFVVASSGIMVSGVEQRAYTIWQSGQVIAAYDPAGSGLITKFD
jgi:hypothetical protein